MKPDKKERIEEILNSLDGTRRAVAPDFFYTRLKARMEKGYDTPVKQSWVLRPVYAFTALMLVLLINAAVILRGNNSAETNAGDSESMQSIAAEYRLNDNAILFDINQDK